MGVWLLGISLISKGERENFSFEFIFIIYLSRLILIL